MAKQIAKQIVYTIEYNGVDGRERTTVDFASFSEAERDAEWERLAAAYAGAAAAGQNIYLYLRKGEKVVDPEAAVKAARAKLDGIDRLVLEV